MHRLFLILLALLLGLSAIADNDQLSATAAQHYTDQNWAAAITAYQQLLKEGQQLPETSVHQAWYRLAQSHIHLQQGQQALTANTNLADAKQIPKTFILYQKAQALNLMNEEKKMVQTLQALSAAGYSNVKELQNNPMWHKYASHEQFEQVMKQVDKNFRPCMYDDRYRQFDFWLGQWEVYGNLEKTGPLYGHNSITLAEQGCLIMEHWQGASGSSGTSMNYYDGIISQWVQRWVSSGVVIDYTGGLVESTDDQHAMQLVGKIYYASELQQPQIRDFRGTWTPLEGGVVQQFFEESIDGGKTWYTWFNGYYFPKQEGE